MPVIFSLLALAAAAPPAEPRDGDRVAFVGGTLVEREQQSGCWEAALVARYPGRSFTVRNLGWSGDTVGGESRAGFGTPADGFRKLLDHVAAVKPTLLLVNYGSVEAFAGPAGLPAFERDLAKLLDALARPRARVVLLAPPAAETLGPPLPDPAAYNAALPAYRDALRSAADRRGLGFADLASAFAGAAGGGPLTDNNLHPTPDGYRRTAAGVLRALGLPDPAAWRVELAAGGKVAAADGTKVEPRGPLAWSCRDETLPLGPRTVTATGLPAGKHTLRVDGTPVATADAADWAKGVPVTKGPEFDQYEQLRRAIVAKNTLYFHRYRPQNETYLFGFRKHEQGKNAAEMPQFDPLVAAKEAEIARLRTPAPHTYTLTPAKD